MQEPTPTVFIVDDDVSIQESLETLIEVAGWTPRVFASGEAFLASPPAAGPSCLILDVNLPDLNGLKLQPLLASKRRDMPIIFITGYGDIPMSVQAMKAGAAEFLTKPFKGDELVRAVGEALERSRTAVDEQAALQTLRDRYALLSRRERQVMSLVVQGLLNKQVGGELGISEITVKAHRGRAMEKMQARSLAELVRMSQRLDLALPRLQAGIGPRTDT
jgi:FixJ family two-component response regulator